MPLWVSGLALAALLLGGYAVAALGPALLGVSAEVPFAGSDLRVPPPEVKLIAVGDIASCDSEHDEAVAQVVARLPGTLAILGDVVYEVGSTAEFENCYKPAWDAQRSRARPAVGNHEYRTPGAAAYYAYFGPAAGDPARGYYSYELGNWLILVLNSNCEEIGGCSVGSAQHQWLRSALAASSAYCQLAYWHHPQFTSSEFNSGDPGMGDIWQLLYAFGVDVVLNGHDHLYERYAPHDADGVDDPAFGIRQFIVGTGGRSLYPFQRLVHPNSQVRNNTEYGVLLLTLHPRSYDWMFVPVEGGSFQDADGTSCHGAPPAGRE